MEHETDYQRARRQRFEVKKYGITGSTPHEASKRIKEHTSAKSKALHRVKGKKESFPKFERKTKQHLVDFEDAARERRLGNK